MSRQLDAWQVEDIERDARDADESRRTLRMALVWGAVVFVAGLALVAYDAASPPPPPPPPCGCPCPPW